MKQESQENYRKQKRLNREHLGQDRKQDRRDSEQERQDSKTAEVIERTIGKVRKHR
jgi:hypothetical protein